MPNFVITFILHYSKLFFVIPGEILNHIITHILRKITHRKSQGTLKSKIQEVGRAATFWCLEAIEACKISILLMVPDFTNLILYETKEKSLSSKFFIMFISILLFQNILLSWMMSIMLVIWHWQREKRPEGGNIEGISRQTLI